jgi:phage virion morphogenesis protein
MASDTFSISLDNLKVTKNNYQKIEKRLRNMRHILDVIGQYMTTESQENISREREFSGKKWKPSAAAKNRKKGNGKTLFDQGHLFQSITHKVKDKYSVDFGANVSGVGTVIYARIHQWGGKTGRNHSVNLPARKYIGMTKDNEKEVTRQLYNWILR